MSGKRGGWFFVKVVPVVPFQVVFAVALLLVVSNVVEARSITFSKDVAPIIFQNCSACHRPGESAPFPLQNYADVKKRARQIAEATQSRYMPPWLPQPGYGEFQNERRLTADEIATIQNWFRSGAREGDPADLPKPPEWKSGWRLGEPDLIVETKQPFLLPASGADVYRNFIFPINLASNRHVRAWEFRPGNPKLVHHAFVKIDPSRQSRRLEGRDGAPGFPGMATPDTAFTPEGDFLGWQPGSLPASRPAAHAWLLPGRCDLILQEHLRTTGKVEPVESRLGLYFTANAPTNHSLKFHLSSLAIDIPAGETNYSVSDEFVLPVPVRILGVLPHAHYLCKTMEGFAILPDGTTRWLLRINEWDFNWQGDYIYAAPVELPRGTKIQMRFTYDNSADNSRNPNSPPKRVVFGAQSSDEMAELWFEAALDTADDLQILSKTYSQIQRKRVRAYDELQSRVNPTNTASRLNLAIALLSESRLPEAEEQTKAALAINPRDDRAYYIEGLIQRATDHLPEARAAFERSIQLNGNFSKAHANLGLVLMAQEEWRAAAEQFEASLRLNPDDFIAHDSLGIVLAELGKLAQSEFHFREAVRLEPNDGAAREHLSRITSERRRRNNRGSP
jgi:tetratricopeptide (TPR) repeat protein